MEIPAPARLPRGPATPVTSDRRFTSSAPPWASARSHPRGCASQPSKQPSVWMASRKCPSTPPRPDTSDNEMRVAGPTSTSQEALATVVPCQGRTALHVVETAGLDRGESTDANDTYMAGETTPSWRSPCRPAYAFGADGAAQPRRGTAGRCTPALLGQGTKRTRHAAATPNRVAPTHLDERVRRALRRSAVSHPSGHPAQPRRPLTALVAKHTAAAAQREPSLTAKNVTPHVLRHSCAMALLRGGVDRSVLALWLGHEQVETTSMYLHADLSIKERALDRTKTTRQAGPIPGSRPAPRLPQRALIMSTAIDRCGPTDSITTPRPHNPRATA